MFDDAVLKLYWIGCWGEAKCKTTKRQYGRNPIFCKKKKKHKTPHPYWERMKKMVDKHFCWQWWTKSTHLSIPPSIQNTDFERCSFKLIVNSILNIHQNVMDKMLKIMNIMFRFKRSNNKVFFFFFFSCSFQPNIFLPLFSKVIISHHGNIGCVLR